MRRSRRQIQRKTRGAIVSAVMVMPLPHKVMNTPGLGWWQRYNMMLGPLIPDRCRVRSRVRGWGDSGAVARVMPVYSWPSVACILVALLSCVFLYHLGHLGWYRLVTWELLRLQAPYGTQILLPAIIRIKGEHIPWFLPTSLRQGEFQRLFHSRQSLRTGPDPF